MAKLARSTFPEGVEPGTIRRKAIVAGREESLHGRPAWQVSVKFRLCSDLPAMHNFAMGTNNVLACAYLQSASLAPKRTGRVPQ